MARIPAIVPTRRAAILIAVAAPVALLIAAVAPGAWIVAPAAGLALLVTIIGDALAAGKLVDAAIAAPSDIEIGTEGWLDVHAAFSGGARSRVDCALEADMRLMPGGRLEFPVPAEAAGSNRATVPFTATRRGTATVERMWLLWAGPLGLGARQVRRKVGQDVRIWPNVAAARSPALQTFLKDSQFGLIARRIRGEGTEFEALSDYRQGMDRRRIDWKSSARHAQLYAKEFETERNNQIVFAFDCGQSMCEPVDGLPRIDRAVSAALATAYVALKSGDRVGLFGFAARPDVMTPFFAGTGNFHRLQSAAAGLEYRAQEPNFTLALATLAGRLQRRSLIVVFSDFSDPTSAELMIESIGRLVARHVVLFVTFDDAELEDMAAAPPADMQALTMAVTADSLLTQRALVTRRLKQLGVDVIEAPHDKVGTRLIDAYLAAKRTGAIG